MPLYDLDLAIAYSQYRNKTSIYAAFGIKYGDGLQGRLHWAFYLSNQAQERSVILDGAEGSLYVSVGPAELAQIRELDWLR